MAKKKQSKLKARPNSELKEIALKITQDKVFTDRHIAEHDKHLMGTIFMPILFMKKADLDALQRKGVIGFFADYDDALPRSINGYPIFSKFSTLTRDELVIIDKYVTAFRKAIANVK